MCGANCLILVLLLFETIFMTGYSLFGTTKNAFLPNSLDLIYNHNSGD